MRSTLMPRMKPAPPKICTASEAQNAMVCVAMFFIMQISATGFSPWPSRQANSSSIDCEAATRCAMSTILWRITWCWAIGLPKVLRSLA